MRTKILEEKQFVAVSLFDRCIGVLLLDKMSIDENVAQTASDPFGTKAVGDSLWSNTEEEDCCRVCHGAVEESRPLFHPCRCSGSIKFVHQDCLQTWLKISNQTNPKCELCGEQFHFRNIYKSSGLEGKPPKLSIFEFMQGLFAILDESLLDFARCISYIFIWYIAFPICNYWWIAFSDSIIFEGAVHNEQIHLSMPINKIISSWCVLK